MTTSSRKHKADRRDEGPSLSRSDHVYLPLGPDGNVVAGWTAPNVFTTKVLRRTRLRAPADLARFLADRDQAEITTSARPGRAVMTQRLLGFDPPPGWRNGGSRTARATGRRSPPRRSAPLLDLNREAQNHCDPYNTAHDVRMVARIPLIIIAKWRNELGVDYWNPDHQDKVDELLNNADWRWLRTDGGRCT